mmetsp:Transcript_84651/g.218181  ORF Transcript_84651/g.218181 Transcript_84651/m.218181 type:complete len:743 (-) Transcript_84651:53-2281(-)
MATTGTSGRRRLLLEAGDVGLQLRPPASPSLPVLLPGQSPDETRLPEEGGGLPQVIGRSDSDPPRRRHEAGPPSSGSASPTSAGVNDNDAVINRIAGCGFSLKALLQFVCTLHNAAWALQELEGWKETLERGRLLQDDGTLNADLSFFSESSTTWEVAHKGIVPLTARAGSALAPIIMNGQPVYPKCLITHTWSSRFLYTVAAAVADAMEDACFFHIVQLLRTYDGVVDLMSRLGVKRLSFTYWLCAMSINQHLVVCHEECLCGKQKVTEGPDSEIGAFDIMMTNLQKRHMDSSKPFYQCIAEDKDSEFKAQLWTHNVGLDGRPDLGFTFDPHDMTILSIQDDGALAQWHTEKQPKDPRVRIGDRIHEVNGLRGAAAREMLEETPGQLDITFRRSASVYTRIWVVAEVRQAQDNIIEQRVVAHFPHYEYSPWLRCCRRIVAPRALIDHIDVRGCEATKDADRKRILGKISDVAIYNREVRRAFRLQLVRALVLRDGFVRLSWCCCLWRQRCLPAVERTLARLPSWTMSSVSGLLILLSPLMVCAMAIGGFAGFLLGEALPEADWQRDASQRASDWRSIQDPTRRVVLQQVMPCIVFLLGFVTGGEVGAPLGPILTASVELPREHLDDALHEAKGALAHAPRPVRLAAALLCRHVRRNTSEREPSDDLLLAWFGISLICLIPPAVIRQIVILTLTPDGRVAAGLHVMVLVGFACFSLLSGFLAALLFEYFNFNSRRNRFDAAT